MYKWLVATYMPLNLIFVRHGESEGNVAMDMIAKGLYHQIPKEMIGKPGWQWRLTPTGIWQAEAAGNWMRQHLPPIHAAFVSPHVRCMETADHLHLQVERDQEYYDEWMLCLDSIERKYGLWDCVPYEHQLEDYLRCRQGRHTNPLYWTPTGGESIHDVMARVYRISGRLHREHSNHNVVFSNHGETELAELLHLGRIWPQTFYAMKRKKDPLLDIRNCQILHFTRVNPETGEVSDHLDWVRSVCPWDCKDNPEGDWRVINRRKKSSLELRNTYEKYPRYFTAA